MKARISEVEQRIDRDVQEIVGEIKKLRHSISDLGANDDKIDVGLRQVLDFKRDGELALAKVQASLEHLSDQVNAISGRSEVNVEQTQTSTGGGDLNVAESGGEIKR